MYTLQLSTLCTFYTVHTQCMVYTLSGASPASTVHTLHNPALLQLGLGHPADTVRRKVCVTCLNTSKTTQILISLFLPLCYESSICYFLLDTVIIQLSGDGLPPVEQIKDVSGLLVVNLEYGPHRLRLPLTLVDRKSVV